MSNRYLFLLSSLPPSRSANGLCIKKIIENLPDLKDVFAITIEDGSPQNDLNINEIRIPQRNWNRFYNFYKEKKSIPLVAVVCLSLLFLKRLIMLPIWPIFSLTCCFHFFKKSSELIKTKKITHVIAVCYPGETLLCMILLKIRFGKHIKTVMYPLDVLLCGKYDGFALENKISKIFSIFFNKICAYFADKIIVLENAKYLYEKILHHHKEKFMVCGLPLIENCPSVEKKVNQNNIQLLYGGNIIASIRNPDFLFQILNECSLKHNVKFSIHIYGSVNEKLLNRFIKKYKSIKFFYYGWVSEEVLSQAIKDSDALISVGNSVRHLIPCKIFKYISLKKPIIHLSFIDNDPCLSYLQTYGFSYIIKQNSPVNEQDLTDWLHSMNKKIDIDCEKLFYQCTPRYTVDKLQF